MSDAPKKSWLRFWIKMLLYGVIFFAVILTTLSMLGGTSDTLKSGVEQFFSRSFGHSAHIEKLNGLHFFPDFRLDIEGLVIEDAPETKVLVAKLDSLKVAMGFWDMFFQSGNIKAFDVQGVVMTPGFIHPAEIVVTRLSLLHPQGGEPFLDGVGSLGGQLWSLRMDLKSVGTAPQIFYHFGERRPFKISLAELGMEGALVNEGDGLVVEGFKVTRGSRDFLAGEVSLNFPAESLTHIGGEMTLAGKDTLKPSLDMKYSEDGLTVSGDVQTPLAQADLENAFEGLRLDIQRASSYPPQSDGHRMILGIPLETNIKAVMP